METHALIEQAAAQYRQLDQVGVEVEQAVQNNELAALPELCARLNTLQEQARALDADLLELVRRQPELRELAVTGEWLRLMHGIGERNRRLMPRLKSIVAVQRNELHTLRKGNSMLQGYKPGIAQTGRRISSSG